MPTADETEVLNLERLEDSAGGDRALMLELVSLYLEDSDAKMPRLFSAAEAAELHRMGRVAHGLKGSSAVLGCEQAAEAFRLVEDMGRVGAEDGLDDALEAARCAWQQACEQLRGLAA
jgi:HPt (histidine-containing phosphotransfer) domain-containing protein